MPEYRLPSYIYKLPIFPIGNLAWFFFCLWEILIFTATLCCLADTYINISMQNSTVPINQGIPDTCASFQYEASNFYRIVNLLAIFVCIALLLLMGHCIIHFIKLCLRLVKIAKLSYEDADTLAEKVYNCILSKRSYPGANEDVASLSYLFFCQFAFLLIILLLNKESSIAIYGKLFSEGNNTTATVNTDNNEWGVCGETSQSYSSEDLSMMCVLCISIFVLQLVMLVYQVLMELLLSSSTRVRAMALCYIKVDEDLARQLGPMLDLRGMELISDLNRTDILPKVHKLLSGSGSNL